MNFPIPALEFPTSQFLGFFATVFFVYWALRRHRWRMLWLLAASCIFYMSFRPWLILLIVASASVDYVVALRLQSVSRLWLRRTLLTSSICFNLSLLAFYKYSNFLLGTSNSLFGLFGSDYQWPLFDKLYLPLGISFYTFETISYVVDVYQGKTKPVRSLLDYALYIMFFPHLAAGPIVRPRDFLPQIQRRKRLSWYRVVVGLLIFLVGLFKKAVIADNLAPVADLVFADPSAYASSAVWLGTLAYAVQIYCDFSGYSDMAMGLAHMLGFKLPLNFNMPYFAANITDFWRRWHISLSSWLRDYLYVPLGGNRHGSLATYRNLMLTMLLGGLWHGANWTFVLWGGYHGLLLSLHRVLGGGTPKAKREDVGPWSALRLPACVLLTFLSVCVGWVFFRAQTFANAAQMLAAMVWPTAGNSLDPAATVLVVACLLLIFSAHLVGSLANVPVVWRRWPAPVVGGTLAALLLMALLLMPENMQGFIYFQF